MPRFVAERVFAKRRYTTIHCPHIGFVALLLAMAIFAGCGKEPAAPATQPAHTTTIGYAAPELYGGQTIIMNGLLHHAQAKGWKVLVANADLNAQNQNEQIQRFISKRLDAIVAVPVDSRGIKPAIESARVAGIPFYTIDRAPLDCPINMAVLSDNALAGVQAGNHLVSALQAQNGSPRGLVLELAGDMRQNVAQLRGQGFHLVVDRYPQITVVTRETQWLAARHAQLLEAQLKDKPPDAIYLQSDATGLSSVLTVLRQAGHLEPTPKPAHIIIVGVDGTPEMLQAIRDGFADQTSSQPLPDFGMIADWIEMDLAHRAYSESSISRPGALWSPASLKHTQEGWVLLLSTTSVTRTNVDDARLWGNQHKGISRLATPPRMAGRF